MKLLYALVFALFSVCAFGQYAFESKKAEKLYYKLDEAYLDYDYATILANEDAATEAFLANEDTIAANVYNFLAESYDYELGDFQTALDFYNLELELRKKVDPDGDRKNLLYNMATLQQELGYYQQAEQVLLDIRKTDAETFGKKSAEYFDASRALVELYLQTEQVSESLETASDIQKSVEKKYHRGRCFTEMDWRCVCH